MLNFYCLSNSESIFLNQPMKTKCISDFIIDKNIFAGCEVHGGGNEFYRSARRRRVEMRTWGGRTVIVTQ
jgi:hypothetical protein